MSKKKETETKPNEVKPEEVKPEETKPDEVKPEEAKPDEVKPEDVKPEETKPEKPEKSGEIEPIAYAIKLRDNHPHDSYGRCGYRFKKGEALEIPAADLSGAQVITLAEDPWLELVPVCAE